MEIAKLVLFCLAAVCGAGAVIGEAAAWVCAEAFTLYREKSFGDLHAALLGPLWTVLDFLMPGVVVGVAVAIAANVGPRPAVKAFFFTKPLAAHATLMLVTALLAGVAGYFAATNGLWHLPGAVTAAIAPERLPLFAAVWWAGLGAQCANFAGGIALAVWIWRKRAVFEAMVQARS